MKTKEIVAGIAAAVVGVGVASLELDNITKKFDDDCDEGRGKITTALHVIGGFGILSVKVVVAETVILWTVLSVFKQKE